jgi:transposase
MVDPTGTLAGLDVHLRTTQVTVVADRCVTAEIEMRTDLVVVERALRAHGVTACCYEAGPTGFGLARHLNSVGIRCEVIAPGLVWNRPGDRVKTDRRDARRLAQQFAGGLLTPIWIPPRDLEALRDLVRCREDARRDRMASRNRLRRFLDRHGRTLPEKSWTLKRRVWLGQQVFDDAAQMAAFSDYVETVDLCDARIGKLERLLAEQAQTGAYHDQIQQLRVLRGVDTLTAVGLISEIGDFTRFATAPAFMSFVGLVPSEHSSGERRQRSSITRAGNGHARRLLVEAAWNQRRRPATSADIQRRRRDHDPDLISRAQRAELRLHNRWIRMRRRNKPETVIAVAVARELAGFVWAVATRQPLTDTNRTKRPA